MPAVFSRLLGNMAFITARVMRTTTVVHTQSADAVVVWVAADAVARAFSLRQEC